MTSGKIADITEEILIIKLLLSMNKQSKFELLQKIALTRDEAEEFFDLQEEKSSVNKVFLPFSIVYLSLKHRLRVLPYLDLLQKEKVWGISFHGILVHIKDVENADTFRKLKFALKKENSVCDKFSRFRNFPSMSDWEHIFAKISKFNEMMQKLRDYGIKAEDLHTYTRYLTDNGLWESFSPEPDTFGFARDDDTPIKSRFVVYL